jgi:hypothetical protein
MIKETSQEYKRSPATESSQSRPRQVRMFQEKFSQKHEHNKIPDNVSNFYNWGIVQKQYILILWGETKSCAAKRKCS